jgi:hypothetical protein
MIFWRCATADGSWRRGSMLDCECFFFQKGLFLYILELSSTLLHLPPFRYRCVGECRDFEPQDCWDFGTWQSDALTTRLKIHYIPF